MSPKRFFLVMAGALAVLGICIIFAILGANALLGKQSKKLLEAKVENKAVEQQQTYLIQAKKDIEKYSELNAITKSIVPQDKDQAKTVRELSAIAGASGIKLKSISFAPSNLGQNAAVSSGSPSSASASKSSAISQVKPVEGIPGVYSLEIIISPEDNAAISYYTFLNFLERLESNRRTANVVKITLSPSEDGSSLTFILTLEAYLKP